jgi:hypothetical protein
MAYYAAMRAMEVWYDHLDVELVIAAFRAQDRNF